MRLTIDIHTEDLNSEGMAALTALINGTKSEGMYVRDAKELDVPSSKPEKTPFEEISEETPSEENEPRVYGEPGPGRKRRSKEEKAEDDEIDALAEKTGLAITTDKPAADLLAEMREEAEKSEDEGFDMDTDEEPMSAEEFRAMAIGFNKKHGKAVNAILAKYGSGLSKIPADKYAEVKAKLEEEFGSA